MVYEYSSAIIAELFLSVCQMRLASNQEIQEKEDILPKPAKAGDGKLEGLTIPMVGSQLSGQGHMPGKKRRNP